jgi:hypothetical protein
MILFKRNKDNDTNMESSYYNGSQRIGYDSIVCYNDDDIEKAKRNGWLIQLREVERATKNSKKRNSKKSIKSNVGGDSLHGRT